MVQEQHEIWTETVINEQQFIEAGQKLEAWKTATDFLQLIANGRRPDVVFVSEGYIKQQPLALNYQLPERMADLDDLQPPPQLFWSVGANMLNPARLLCRELCGCSSFGFGSNQQQRVACAQHEQVPLGVVERCKVLDVQYISKQYTTQQQGQDDNPFGEHQGQQPQQHTALTLRITLQRLIDPQRQLLQHVQQQHHCDKENCLQDSACCSREPSPAAVDQQCSPQEQHCLQDQQYQDGTPQPDTRNNQRALVCCFEYPVLHLEGNDFIVPAEEFDQGMADWSKLAPKDEFTMVWDGSPCEGFVEGYRQRKLDDPFWRSPWRSIIIDWKEDPVDRETAPEDWWHGNPWEMERLPKSSAAAVVAAPWTQEGAAVAIAAARAAAAAEKARQAKRASKKRKRANSWAFDDEFYYDAGTVDNGSEPSDTSFFYDDDPEDYIIHLSSRRATQRQRSQRQQQQQRSVSAPGGGGKQRHSAGGGTAAAAAPRQCGGEAADSEPAHSWGRELVGVPDNVCLICRKGSETGELVNMHTGKAQQNCCRRYHVGCLLLLNSAGLRTVYLGKQQLKQHQQQQQQQQQRGSAGAGSSTQAAAAAAAPGGGARSDGLLGELQQLQQQPGNGVSEGLAAAVAEAEAAAALYSKDELSLACPAHCCHGCGLNGKHEFLVWCCCCWVRTYHCRNCVPLGAEKVILSGREYIRCPYCAAANAPLPLQLPLIPTAVPAAAAAQAAGDDERQGCSTAAAGAMEAATAQRDARGTPELAAAAAAAGGGGGGLRAAVGAAGTDHPAGSATDAQPVVGGALLNEHTEAATATELAKAAAAADEIAAELAQQQLLLQLTSSWDHPASTANQQLANDGEPGSHAHTPDVFQILPDEPEGHVLAASGKDNESDAGADSAAVRSAAAAAGPAAAAGSDRLHCADSGSVDFLLLAEKHELEALQQEIECLQQQLQLKQQLYQQKQEQLERKRRQLLLRQHGREADAHAAAARAATATVADATAGTVADDSLDMQHAPVATNVDAAIPADLPNPGMLSALDLLAGAADDVAEAAAEDAAAAAAAQAAASAAYAAAAAAAQAPSEHNPAAMPSWLQLSLEDQELRTPSWKLVPVHDEGGVAAEALQYVADAISRLPVQQQTAPHNAFAAAAGSGSGGGAGESSSGVSCQHGLPLFAPRCHWLIGSREKAEAAKYKVSGSWAGCPVIHVETPDDGVFGVCFVTDHAARFSRASLLPPPEQQQQLEEEEEEGDSHGAAAAVSEGEVADLVRGAAQRRPDVYLRCWKPVVQGGRQKQQQRQQQEGDDRGNRRGVRGEEWEVLVNGRAFPASTGRDGWKLHDGDVVAVQGLQLKLVAV